WLPDRPTPRAFPADGQWLFRVSSPVTVTGSRRIRTAFPGRRQAPGRAQRKNTSKGLRASSTWNKVEPPATRLTIGQNPVAEEPDRFHDLCVRGPTGVRVAQPEQERAGAGSLLPALDLAHARLGIT